MKLKQLQKNYESTKEKTSIRSSTMTLLGSYIVMSVIMTFLYVILQSRKFSLSIKYLVETIFLIMLVLYGFVLIYLHTKGVVKAEERLEKYKEIVKNQSLYNQFYEVWNQRKLYEDINPLMEEHNAFQMCCIFFDIKGVYENSEKNNFYHIEKVLKEVGSILKGMYHDNVYYVDAFRYIVIDTQLKGEESIGQIRSKIGEVFENNKLGYELKFGYGVSCYPKQGMILPELLHKASIAAYYSMTLNHENVTKYQEVIVKQLENRRFFSTYIHRLLEDKGIIIDLIPIHHKKSTSFQLMKLEANIPKIDGSYYNIYEIRAFDNDTYFQIYNYVFEQTCIKIEALKNIGREIKVLINLTLPILEKEGFLDKVLHMLEQHHIEVEQIWFELFNTNFTDINEESIIHIFKLSEKGFTLVLGDSLRSSNHLGIIPRLPVDVINLGSNLTVGALNSMKEYQFLDTLILALHQLELKTMVTGIDDRQLKRLAEKMNIDYICGKVYDDSIPIDEYAG